MNKARVEAITDGITAIAVTIMVLEFAVPSIHEWAGLLELRHTFFAYLSSFFLIYVGWSLHHDLFKNAEVISRPAFMLNGIWIFFLTLVPFTTAWVGTAPDASVSEFFYPLNLLLWGLAFQLLDSRVRKDNPDIEHRRPIRLGFRIYLIIVHVAAIVLAFIKPVFSLYLISLSTLVTIIWTFVSRSRQKD